MKYTRKHLLAYLLVATGMLGVGTSCQDNTENYDNKAFVTTSKVGTILLKGVSETASATIQTAIAKPEATNIKVTYQADTSLADLYNLMYNDKAVILPDGHYEIPEAVSSIAAGTVKGNDVVVHFKDLFKLDREQIYVLPVTVAQSDIAFLNSARTSYFVIKAGALINTVANLTENNLSLQSPEASTLTGMQQFTVEALLRMDKFGKLISTLMGIESYFLIRFGDNGIPDNQLQLATGAGNLTDEAWQIPTNEWVHLAVTCNLENGAIEVFLNGVKKGSTQTVSGIVTLNWNTEDFYIGKSYDDNRWLEGDICECRVWNRVLTVDEINAKNHFYMVTPHTEGLAAYWKFDEGAGEAIADQTGNGNNLRAKNLVTWNSVELPQ